MWMDLLSHYLWVLYEAWTTSVRGGSPTDYIITSNYTPDILSWHPDVGPKRKNHAPHQYCSGLRTTIHVLICYLIIYECYMRHGPHLTGADHPQTISWPPTPDMLSWYPDVGPKRKNHAPHQCCSGPRTTIHVLICYLTVLWGLCMRHWPRQIGVNQPIYH